MSDVLDRLRRQPGLALVALAVAATIAIYAPTLARGLVNHDDPWLLRDNALAQHPSWQALRTIFFELDPDARFSIGHEYLPVRDLSTMLDFALWGTWWPGFHLTSLALYVAAIVLWFAALVSYGVDRTVAGVFVLVWALHPSHAESVAWLAERKGVLGIALAGACALAHARWRRGGTPAWLVLAIVTAAGAVWSKALAAFALPAIGVLELALPARRVSWRRSLVGLVAIGGVATLAFVPVIYVASHGGVVGVAAAPAGRLAMIAGVHGFDVELAVMAVANAIAYPIASEGPSAVQIVLGTTALAALAGVALQPRFAPRELRAAAAIWLVGWLPASHVVVPPQIAADRYLLVPTLGLALGVAVLAMRLPNPRVRAALVAAIAIAGALRSLDAQASWSSSRALWARAVTSAPHDAAAWSYYAEALAEDGDRELAAAAVARGLELVPDAPRLVSRAGLLALADGRRGDAIALLRRAAASGEVRAMANLALLLQADGALDDAYRWAARAVATEPLYVGGHRALGKIALALRRTDVALREFERAVELEPASAVNRYNLDLVRGVIAGAKP